MFNFLFKIVPFHTHRHLGSNSISFTAFELGFLQSQWFSANFYSTTSNKQSFTVSYLINTCGFSPQKASAVSKYITLQTREQPDSVIKFFEKHGFSQAQTFGMLRRTPELLKYNNPEKILLPKVEFFKSRGVLSSDVPKIISKCPAILRRSLQKQIIPAFDFLSNWFQSDEKVIATLKRYSGAAILHRDTFIASNIKLLREEGVPESTIIRFLQRDPHTLIEIPHRFKEIVEQVKEMGFNPSRFNFISAVHAVRSMGKSKWARKADVYKRWGWSDDEFVAAFAAYPLCMTVSEDKIEAIMKFLLNTMGFESSAISKCPVVLALSLNKRIIPRGYVVQVLLSKGLVNKLSLKKIFIPTEKVFLDNFILCHEKEAGGLLKLYQEKMDLCKVTVEQNNLEDCNEATVKVFTL